MNLPNSRITSLRLEAIIDPYPLTVTPDTPLIQVVDLMHLQRAEASEVLTATGVPEARGSCVLVREGTKAIGLFTERDLVRLAVKGVNLEAVTIGEVMTREPITLKQSAYRDIFSVLNQLQEHRIRHLPIVNDAEELIGLTSATLVCQRLRQIELLKLRRVGEVMNRETIQAPPTASLLEVAQLMVDHGVSCVVIAEPLAGSPSLMRPLGIVTERDIVQFQRLKLVQEGLELAATSAQAAIAAPLHTINADANLFEAHRTLQNKMIRRLVITGDRGELLGIVTQTTILRLLEPAELTQILELLQSQENSPRSPKPQTISPANRAYFGSSIAQKREFISVLLLEDDPTYRMIVKRQLQRSPQPPIELTIAGTLAEALGYLQQDTQNTFDAILLDLNLPDSRGVNTLQNMQHSAPNSAIVVLTSTEDEELALQLIQMGAQDYLIKQQVSDHLLTRSITYSISRKQIEIAFQAKNLELAAANEALERNTAQLAQKNQALQDEISQRQQVESALQQLAIDLENRVAERTVKLVSSNQRLKREVEERLLAEARLKSQAEYQRLLNQIALQIRQSLNLEDILNTTVEQVRQLLNCDRVLVYQFDAELNGTVVAESVASGWLTTLGINIEDTCFTSGGALHYQQGVKTALDDIDRSDLSSCYHELLARFQVKANLVVPILLPVRSPQPHEEREDSKEERGKSKEENSLSPLSSILSPIESPCPLWGLLIAHQCSGPRHWQEEELELLDELAVQLAIAIQQAQLYHQAQTELQQRRQAQDALRQLNQDLEQQVLNRTAELEQQYIKSSLFGEITQKIRQSLRLEEILQTTVAEIQKILQCDRVLIYQVLSNGIGRVVAETVSDGSYPQLLDMEFPEETFPPECQEKYLDGSIVAITDIHQGYGENWPCLREFLESWQIQAKLVVPICQSQNNQQLWGQLWGFIIAHHCAAPHQWTDFEQELTRQLANQVAVAVAQASLMASQQNTLQALAYSQEQLQDLFDSTNDLIQSVSLADGSFIYVNQAWLDTLGYSLEEIPQLGYLDAIAPEYHDHCREMWNAFSTGESDRYDAVEISFISKDGRTVILEGDITCRYREGKPAAAQAIFRDVTERRKTQAQLHQALQELAYQKQALDEMAIVTITDPQGIITYVNEKFCEISQYEPSEAIGQTHRIVNSGYHPPSFFKEMWSTIALGQIWRGEVKNRSKDGGFYWMDTTIVPFLDEAGKPLQHLAIRIDVTDRKIAEEGLRQQLAAIEAAIDGIGILHNDRYVFLNQAHAQLFGFPSAADLLGQTWHILYDADEVDRVEREVFPILTQQKHWQGEAIGKRVDGSTFPQELSLTLNDDGDLICVCRDISDRKKAEQQLRKALAKAEEVNELKSRFITMTSHEFRTPLTTILGAAEILKYYGHKWDDEKKMKYLDRIYSTVKHMTGLLDDVLLLGRMESGRLELSPTPINICEFCQSLVEEVKLGIGKEHQIALSCPNNPVAATATYNLDEKVLRHILINLLTNAIKYSPAGSTVNFQVSIEQKDQVKFQIQDQGIGIPPEDQKHLFESFHRAQNVGNIQGTGLGLSIVKKSVDLHQGEIVCQSQLDKGTTFIVTLPSIYTY
jgi:PAS domain S-box-containing protein